MRTASIVNGVHNITLNPRSPNDDAVMRVVECVFLSVNGMRGVTTKNHLNTIYFPTFR